MLTNVMFHYEEKDNRSFVVYEVTEQDLIDNVELDILRMNDINGVLPVNVLRKDDKMELRYDVTTKSSLLAYTTRKLTKEQILRLFEGICKSMENAQDYMLDLNHFIVNTETVYIDSKTAQTGFLFLPAECASVEQCSFGEFIRKLIESILCDDKNAQEIHQQIYSYVKNQDNLLPKELHHKLSEIEKVLITGNNKQEKNKPLGNVGTAKKDEFLIPPQKGREGSMTSNTLHGETIQYVLPNVLQGEIHHVPPNVLQSGAIHVPQNVLQNQVLAPLPEQVQEDEPVEKKKFLFGRKKQKDVVIQRAVDSKDLKKKEKDSSQSNATQTPQVFVPDKSTQGFAIPGMAQNQPVQQDIDNGSEKKGKEKKKNRFSLFKKEKPQSSEQITQPLVKREHDRAQLIQPTVKMPQVTVQPEQPTVQQITPIVQTETNQIQQEKPIVQTETSQIQQEKPIVEAETNQIQKEKSIEQAENSQIQQEKPTVIETPEPDVKSVSAQRHKQGAAIAETVLLGYDEELAYLEPLHKGERIEIDKAELRIGRNPDLVDVVLEDLTVSRIHLWINKKDDGYYVTDIHSKGGTKINGARIKSNHPYLVENGDVIKMGAVEYRFYCQ